jgi:hypothetical protein
LIVIKKENDGILTKPDKMNINLITQTELDNLKNEILTEISNLLEGQQSNKRYLRSSEVEQVLNVSAGTLQNLRINGTIPFSKVGGTIFYSFEDIVKMMEDNKRDAV